MIKFIKARIKLLIEMLPMGRDIYLSLARERLGISYRGIYASRGAALAAVKKDSFEYDLINHHKAGNQAAEELMLGNLLRHYDYPLLFWLSQLLPENPRLLELGGSVGHFYFTSKERIRHPDKLCWTIAELPEAVKLGEKIAREHGATQLQYIDSKHLQQAGAVDIFMVAGTLQYMAQGLGELLLGFKCFPSHVLINYSPVHDGEEDAWTLQNLGVCEVPYRIFSRQALLAAMADLDYKLVEEWDSPRSLEIPFHGRLNLQKYSGFYFHKSHGAASS